MTTPATETPTAAANPSSTVPPPLEHPDLLPTILFYLSPEDIAKRCAPVNRLWRTAAGSDAVWTALLSAQFPTGEAITRAWQRKRRPFLQLYKMRMKECVRQGREDAKAMCDEGVTDDERIRRYLAGAFFEVTLTDIRSRGMGGMGAAHPIASVTLPAADDESILRIFSSRGMEMVVHDPKELAALAPWATDVEITLVHPKHRLAVRLSRCYDYKPLGDDGGGNNEEVEDEEGDDDGNEGDEDENEGNGGEENDEGEDAEEEEEDGDADAPPPPPPQPHPSLPPGTAILVSKKMTDGLFLPLSVYHRMELLVDAQLLFLPRGTNAGEGEQRLATRLKIYEERAGIMFPANVPCLHGVLRMFEMALKGKTILKQM